MASGKVLPKNRIVAGLPAVVLAVAAAPIDQAQAAPAPAVPPAAKNGPAAAERPLPASAQPNHGLPEGQRPPVEPPHARAGGPATKLNAAAWRAVERPDAKAAFGQSARTTTAKKSGASAAAAATPRFPFVIR